MNSEDEMEKIRMRQMEKGGFRNIYYTLSPEKLMEKLTYDGKRIIDGLNSAMKQFPENFAIRTGLSTEKKAPTTS